MNTSQPTVDRVQIEALRAEYTDALMMHDFDRLASLFTEDGAVRMPHVPAEATSPEQIRDAVERLQGLFEYFVQTTHPGMIELDGDSAVGRTYLHELMHGHDGSSNVNYGVYHDRYRRTRDGWKFAGRVYELRWGRDPGACCARRGLDLSIMRGLLSVSVAYVRRVRIAAGRWRCRSALLAAWDAGQRAHRVPYRA